MQVKSSPAVLTSSTIMEGWLKVVPSWTAPSKEHMAEAVGEFAELFNEIRTFRKQRDRLAAERKHDLVQAMGPRGRILADMVNNALKTWLRGGEFDCYFMVTSGAVHTTFFCRTINLHTLIKPLPQLAGLPRDEVVGMGYRMCSHCMKRTPEQMHQKVVRFCQGWIEYLSSPPTT
ncbi:hypothetical protein SEA_NANOSMITE_153 [Mycobacterium phage Nanosmite]|nr:hypothetical protein SEA_NANOSMITE_153 [Mycobacterium phage Nanosmite]